MRDLDQLLRCLPARLPSREPFLLPEDRRWGLKVTQPHHTLKHRLPIHSWNCQEKPT